jgi:hypothetical protein
MAGRYVYTCTWARLELRRLHRVLWGHGLLVNQPFDDVVDRMVQPCASCLRKPNPKQCCGWKLDIDRPTALIFKHAEVRGRLVRPELQVQASFARAAAEPGDRWRERPAESSNITIEMYAVENDRLVARHHADLSNSGQEGPVWHLQFGGNPSGAEKLDDGWLSVPRWPAPPGDAVIAADLIAYNFHYNDWLALQEDGDWLRLVNRAEDLMLTNYVERLSAHFGGKPAIDRTTTWLSSQDNMSGGWDPRPVRDTRS